MALDHLHRKNMHDLMTEIEFLVVISKVRDRCTVSELFVEFD